MDRLDGEPVSANMRSARMYYQYESLKEIERKIRLGEVISGFTMKDDPSKMVVAYGTRQRSGLMNCVEVQRINKGIARKCVGLAYVTFVLKNKESEIMEDCDLSFIESRMDHYFIMLPLLDNGDFKQEFAVVFEDWDVADESFRKCLPNLCEMCFAYNVI